MSINNVNNSNPIISGQNFTGGAEQVQNNHSSNGGNATVTSESAGAVGTGVALNLVAGGGELPAGIAYNLQGGAAGAVQYAASNTSAGVTVTADYGTGNSSAGTASGAVSVAKQLDEAWAEFKDADPSAENFVKIQAKMQRMNQLFQMALSIMNSIDQAKKAAANSISYR